jgi:hypothetical protein
VEPRAADFKREAVDDAGERSPTDAVARFQQKNFVALDMLDLATK